jgi:hypothetical protein
MGKPARKLNFLIDEEVCRDLESLVPTGKRSEFANAVLRKELERIRRRAAVERLVAAGGLGKRFSNREILEGLARDRSAH